MNTSTRLRRAAIVLPACTALAALLGLAGPARAQTGFSVDVQAHAQFSSALYGPAHQDRADGVNSLAGWNLVGQHASADTQRFPTGSIFSEDGVRAFADFQQQNGNGTVRGFAQAGGYYLNQSPETFASASVDIHNIVHVINNRSTPVLLGLNQPTHGTLLSGGTANIMTARASASSYLLAYLQQSPGQFTLIGALTSQGSASYLHDESGIHTTESGDWAGNTHPISTTIVGYANPFDGIEIATLGNITSTIIPPNLDFYVDVTYSALYEVRNLSGNSGFLSFGQADFSGTSHLNYDVTDPDTGLPVTDGVSIELVESIPSPGSLGLTLVCAGLTARRRRRM